MIIYFLMSKPFAYWASLKTGPDDDLDVGWQCERICPNEKVRGVRGSLSGYVKEKIKNISTIMIKGQILFLAQRPFIFFKPWMI